MNRSSAPSRHGRVCVRDCVRVCVASSGNRARIAVAILLSAMAALTHAQAADLIHCKPQVQYACDRERCDRATEDFRHAQTFAYDTDSGLLSACLWTNCYSARGQVMRTRDGTETTIVGNLAAENRPELYPPMVVSLTVDKRGNFVAVWQYSGQGLTFVQGTCTPAQ